MKKLTDRQRAELRRLSQEPQRTYGSSRVRVQNNLVAFGYARYVPVGIGDLCEITAAGRARLRESLTAT